MAQLEHEIKRWVEILVTKGYFFYMDKEQCSDSLKRFMESIQNALTYRLGLDSNSTNNNITFKTEGQSSPVNYRSEVRLAIDANYQITLASSDISVINAETGIKFNLSSSKSLLDLISVVAMGKLLPISKETTKNPRARCKPGTLKNKGKSPGSG